MGSEGDTTTTSTMNGKLSSFPAVEKIVKELFIPVGLEAHPFHVGWYNDLVDTKFQIDYSYNAMALVVLSGPDTFEECVLPYVRTQLEKRPDFTTCDPLDECMKVLLTVAHQKLETAGFANDVFHDFDMYPNRRPKILVQTAAHVAGAVEYFHKDRLKVQTTSTWVKDSKLFGVAIHPEFGGWFAIRGVIVFKDLILDSNNSIPKPGPTIQVNDDDKISLLLEEFGLRWRNDVWRDVLPRLGDRKYSRGFIGYLDTEPGKRWEFIINNNFLHK